MLKEKPALPFYERLFALAVVGFFGLMIGVNIWLFETEIPTDIGIPHQIQNPLIEVTIEGKVLNPGIYQVKKGTLVEEAIQLAQPLENASLKRIKLDSKITRRRKINVR